MESRKKINKALMKVALGCTVEEVTEEYAEVDGQMKLTKRKEIKKDIPPDLKAVQLLLSADGEGGAKGLGEMTDEELVAEKERLLLKLKEESDKEGEVKKEKEKSPPAAVKKRAAGKKKKSVKKKTTAKKRVVKKKEEGEKKED